MNTPQHTLPTVIIGGGPAGLMAAESLISAGQSVTLYDAMPTVGRKFLLAGIGGLNITHAEPYTAFCQRFAQHQPALQTALDDFSNQAVRDWCAELGVETFVGTSERVFPREMKAAPLLRAWLARLKQGGLRILPRHRWCGWHAPNQLQFATPDGSVTVPYQTLILALGGGSWKKLGSDGSWMPLLAAHGIELAPLQASNCGFIADWSEHLRQQCAGAPLKSVTLSFTDVQGQHESRQGELILTERGVEGSLIYAFSARLREMIHAQGAATFYLDLLPQRRLDDLKAAWQRKPAKKSLGAFLKGSLKLDPVKAALYFEAQRPGPETLKALPITVTATTAIDEAISTAGGVKFSALNAQLMLKALPGVFCAGEMLDWEAPTGGYLLTACMATGKLAGRGALDWQHSSATPPR